MRWIKRGAEIMESLYFSYGGEIKIRNFLLYQPRVRDIVELGEDGENIYSSYLNLMTTSAKAIADIYWVEHGIWYEEINDWDLFCQRAPVNNLYKDAFRFFFKKEFIMTKLANNNIVFVGYDKNDFDIDNNMSEDDILSLIKDSDKIVIFYEMDFILIRKMLKEINFIPKTERFEKGGNMRTKKYLLKQVYKKRKRNRDGDQNIASMVSTVSVAQGLGNDIWDYPIYRLHQEYRRVLKKEEYQNIVNGYYGGKIDIKKSKINLQNKHWSNKIS
jgi:hypothetical protein